MNRKRSSFSGKLGFVLSAAGASVGLGNIWRFPYLAAKYGGGIFLLVYIILALTFGYTMIVAETALGRMTKKSPVGAYESFGKSKWLSFGGWINAVIPILIVPYYSAPVDFPQETAVGALARYVSNESVTDFQPMNVNFGIIPPLGYRVKGKRNKNAELSKRALELLDGLDWR